jgi:hypothetical protein
MQEELSPKVRRCVDLAGRLMAEIVSSGGVPVIVIGGKLHEHGVEYIVTSSMEPHGTYDVLARVTKLASKALEREN